MVALDDSAYVNLFPLTPLKYPNVGIKNKADNPEPKFGVMKAKKIPPQCLLPADVLAPTFSGGQILYGLGIYSTSCDRFTIVKNKFHYWYLSSWIVEWNAWLDQQHLSQTKFRQRQEGLKVLHQVLADQDLLSVQMPPLDNLMPEGY